MKSKFNWKIAFILACILIVVIVSFYQAMLNIESARIADLIKIVDELEALNTSLFEKLGYPTMIY